MASKKMKVMFNESTFEVAYDRMTTKKESKPVIKHCVNHGEKTQLEVKQKTKTSGAIVGKSIKVWADDAGQEYPASAITTLVNEQPTEKVSQTKIFEIIKFDPISMYTEEFVIEKYYELAPSNNGMEKDIDREMAVNANMVGMYDLYDYLIKENKVAFGEFNPSSAGYITSYGYIRAITIDGKWTLEVGSFKERKCFQFLHEGKPTMKVPLAKKAANKVSMI